jgi:transposase
MMSVARNARISGAQRARLGGEISRAYGKGASVREIAARYGRSYGSVHRLLVENEVALRGRGGARFGPRSARATTTER